MNRKIKLYQIDAFGDQIFSGNPAAVCPLDSWLPEETMQKIAEENNLSETAFLVREHEGFRIRWFTPLVEVALCGHATLAAAYVLFHITGEAAGSVTFSSQSGPLTVAQQNDYITLDFPADPPQVAEPPDQLTTALGVEGQQWLKGETDYLVILTDQEQVAQVRPDFSLLKKVDARGVIVTAPGKEVDFVSRFFAPACGVDEDPVTGSAHCTLTPYWSGRLGKQELEARQISTRGGSIRCQLLGDRVILSGQCSIYLQGEIQLV